MEREIFISYSRRNLDRVSAIKKEIEKATGAKCWMDLEGIESGSPEFDEVIVKGIMESKAFLFMMSKDSQESEYAINELELARRKMREYKDYKLALVNIDNCEMTNIFYFRYNRIDIIEWNRPEQHDKLIRDLRKWIGVKEQIETTTTTPQQQPNHKHTHKVHIKNIKQKDIVSQNIGIPKIVEPPNRENINKNNKVDALFAFVRKNHWKAVILICLCCCILVGLTPIVFNKQIESDTSTLHNHTYYKVNGVDFKMVFVEGGTFQMGNNNNDYDDEKPVHNVTLSSFYIGQTEVTQALWKAVMNYNPSCFKGDELPVERVSYNDCQEFIARINELTGENFRLPTEAEWEFAARGGNKSQGYAYSGSYEINDVAWNRINSDTITHKVAEKLPNELGIYDMSGNVWEWCQDYYAPYSAEAQTNPTGPVSGDRHVYRGGSFWGLLDFCHISFRGGASSRYSDSTVGLRLVL